MRRICFTLAALAVCLGAWPAAAQSQDCELHIWPGSSLGSVYHGWFHGGIVNGAVTGREGYPEVPPDPLGTSEQVALLEEAQPQSLLRLPTHRLVVHPDALSSREIRTSTTRLGGSESPCYAELIVDDVFFQQDVVSGSFLKILFRYRDFGAGAAPIRTFGTWVKTPLATFPPKLAADLPAALREIRNAYKADVALFAAAVLKPAKKR